MSSNNVITLVPTVAPPPAPPLTPAQSAMPEQPSDAELYLLREFFKAWGTFHAAAADKKPRTEIQRLAQLMTDWATSLRNFYNVGNAGAYGHNAPREPL